MYTLTLIQVVIFSMLFNEIIGTRRIVDGVKIMEPKRYVVYLTKSSISEKDYDTWICGGAIVSTEYIVTSAACVEDVKHMYAIAGYSVYVPDKRIYTDRCTSVMKKKIVFTCIPKSYTLDYSKLAKWSYIDIAIVKVESPFNFFDKRYELLCSYMPQAIQVNYENKYQEADIDAIVLGWGHAEIWRLPNDTNNYNQADLHYASILIADKEECKKHYSAYEDMVKVIDMYMICSMVEGNINERGELRVKSPPGAIDGCTPKQQKLLGFEGLSCEDQSDQIIFLENRRYDKMNNNTIEKDNNTMYRNSENATVREEYIKTSNISNRTLSYLYRSTRKNGICQNDHGGPVVTWVGGHEVLIGVASVFKVSKDMRCIGPYLYTSTQCNGAFLDCLLSSDDNKSELARNPTQNSEMREVMSRVPIWEIFYMGGKPSVIVRRRKRDLKQLKHIYRGATTLTGHQKMNVIRKSYTQATNC